MDSSYMGVNDRVGQHALLLMATASTPDLPDRVRFSRSHVPKIRFPQCLWGTSAIAHSIGFQPGVNRDRGEWLDQASCLGFTIAVVVIKISHDLIGDQIPQGVENKKMGIPTKIAIAKWQRTFFDQGFKQYEQSAEKLWNGCGKPLLDCGKRHLK